MRRRSDTAGRALNAYVYAFVSGPAGTLHIAGCTIEVVSIARVHVALDWRATAPKVSPAAVRRQHALVERLADLRRSVVPARFGSVIAAADLRRLVSTRSGDLRRAMALVRDRVQMTVRFQADLPSEATGSRPASGTDYLNRRRAAASAASSPGAAAIRRAVRTSIVEERVSVEAAEERIALFHLIRRSAVARYRAKVLEACERAGVQATVTGPFPPFAFAPDLWT